ncbi:hypothetical protein BJV78DRAFT_319508 [Lactifluus subvellereus]|nr:hypothetical protein BJV78DRAFT_319508 [Lactifluus subvellereus]
MTEFCASLAATWVPILARCVPNAPNSTCGASFHRQDAVRHCRCASSPSSTYSEASGGLSASSLNTLLLLPPLLLRRLNYCLDPADHPQGWRRSCGRV